MTAALYPFSILYDGITRGRNQLYDRGLLHSFGFDRALICVGNLSVGGTGKTPMVEYLLRLLLPYHSLATLSRGYGRKTRGFRLASADDNALTLGDEPYQYYRKWNGKLPVTVGEDRALAITHLLKEHPEVEVILLDDAYQHRRIRADLNILLTTYGSPFWEDYLLPAGRLRESRKGAKRAHALVLTKCPEILSPAEEQVLRQKAELYLKQGTPVFFSTIAYDEPQPLTPAATKISVEPWTAALLLSGLAKPQPLEEWVKERYQLLEHQQYSDHHSFTPANIERLKQAYLQQGSSKTIIFTSEKDAVRLLQPHLEPLLQELPLYYIPIRQRFLSNGSEAFDSLIIKSVAEKLRDRS